MVGMAVAGDVTKRQRVVGGPLDLAAGVTAGGVAVDQQRQQRRRVIRGTALAGIGPLQVAQVQPFHHLDHVARQVPLGQPLLHRRRQEEVDVAVDRTEVAHRRRPSGLMALFYRDSRRPAAGKSDRLLAAASGIGRTLSAPGFPRRCRSGPSCHGRGRRAAPPPARRCRSRPPPPFRLADPDPAAPAPTAADAAWSTRSDRSR